MLLSSGNLLRQSHSGAPEAITPWMPLRTAGYFSSHGGAVQGELLSQWHHILVCSS